MRARWLFMGGCLGLATMVHLMNPGSTGYAQDNSEHETGDSPPQEDITDPPNKLVPVGVIEDPNMVSCVTEICGEASKVESAFEIISAKMPKATNLGYGIRTLAFKSQIHRLLDLEMANARIQLKIMKEARKNPQLEPSPELASLHDWLFVMSGLSYAVFELKQEDANAPLVIDVQKTRTAMEQAGIPKPQIDWMIEGLQIMLKSPYGDFEDMAGELPPADFYKKHAPGLSLSAALKKDALDLIQKYKPFKTGKNAETLALFGDIEHVIREDLLKRASREEPLTDAEVIRFMATRRAIIMITDVFNPRENGGQTILPQTHAPESLGDFLKRIDIDQKIKNYELLLANDTEIAKARDAVVDACLMNFTMNGYGAPSDAQIHNLAKVAETVKQAAIKLPLAFLSVPTRSLLDEQLKNVTFTLPTTADKFRKFFQDRVKDEIRDLEIELKSDETLLKTGKSGPMALVSLQTAESDLSQPQLFSTTSSMCDEFPPDILRDASRTTTGSVIVSSISATHPDYGKEIIGHEMGHIMSATILSEKASKKSRGDYETVRNCLAGYHPGLVNGSAHPYAEEDWSDIISAKLSGPDSKNLACVFIEQEDNKYVHLEMQNFNVSDPHSSDFFRLLHFHILKGKPLPDSCKTAAHFGSDNPEIKSCL